MCRSLRQRNLHNGRVEPIYIGAPTLVYSPSIGFLTAYYGGNARYDKLESSYWQERKIGNMQTVQIVSYSEPVDPEDIREIYGDEVWVKVYNNLELYGILMKDCDMLINNRTWHCYGYWFRIVTGEPRDGTNIRIYSSDGKHTMELNEPILHHRRPMFQKRLWSI